MNKEKKYVEYRFAFMDKAGAIVSHVMPVLADDRAMSKEGIFALAEHFLENNHYSFKGHNNLQIIEAHPHDEDDFKTYPSFNYVEEKGYHLFITEITMGHPSMPDMIKGVSIKECLQSPYVLNTARIRQIEKDYCMDEIREGYRLLGISCTEIEPFSTEIAEEWRRFKEEEEKELETAEKAEVIDEPKSGDEVPHTLAETVEEESKKGEPALEQTQQQKKRDLCAMDIPEDQREYLWIRIVDGDDPMCWIPAVRNIKTGKVYSCQGEMIPDDEHELDDTQLFESNPFKSVGFEIKKVEGGEPECRHNRGCWVSSCTCDPRIVVIGIRRK